MKRFRTPVAKPGELLAKYGQEHGDRDLFYCYPDNECGMGRDSKMLMLAFERTPIIAGKTLRQELEARGYDITTLKFSVMKKTPNAGIHRRPAALSRGVLWNDGFGVTDRQLLKDET